MYCVENVAWLQSVDWSQATFSTQCTHLATQLSNITTATTGQTTTGRALCGECCLIPVSRLESGNILHTLHTSCHPTLQNHNSYNRTDNYRQWNFEISWQIFGKNTQIPRFMKFLSNRNRVVCMRRDGQTDRPDADTCRLFAIFAKAPARPGNKPVTYWQPNCGWKWKLGNE